MLKEREGALLIVCPALQGRAAKPRRTLDVLGAALRINEGHLLARRRRILTDRAALRAMGKI